MTNKSNIANVKATRHTIEDDEILNARLLYSENAKVAAVFWEWRHKVMTGFFTAIAAAVAMAGWFYQHSELRPWVFVPFIMAAVFSILSDIMDRVNTKVLRECYRLGMTMEEKFSNDGGIFEAIQDMHYKRGSYNKPLRVIYISSAIIFLVAAILTGVLFR